MLIQQLKTAVLVLQQLWTREEGQDLVEYILLFALIAVAAIVGITAFGGRVQELYESIIGSF